MVLEKTFESPLDCKEIQPVHPKAHQAWVFTGRTDIEAETAISEEKRMIEEEEGREGDDRG